MNEQTLDYKKMFENLQNMINNKLKQEQEYFSLLREIDELKPYSAMAAAHMLNMKIADQIMLLKCIEMTGVVSKKLCEKYSFDEEGEQADDR